MRFQNKKNKSYGFVLLFSLLISSILLATGLGISRLMVRQIGLASLSRESQVAFFAADSGMECALHWDLFDRFNPLGDPTKSESRTLYCSGAVIKDGLSGVVSGSIRNDGCDILGGPPSVNVLNGGNKSCFTFSLANEACAFVIVDKSDLANLGITRITANGFNKCSLSAPNILQRTLEITLFPPLP